MDGRVRRAGTRPGGYGAHLNAARRGSIGAFIVRRHALARSSLYMNGRYAWDQARWGAIGGGDYAAVHWAFSASFEVSFRSLEEDEDEGIWGYRPIIGIHVCVIIRIGFLRNF